MKQCLKITLESSKKNASALIQKIAKQANVEGAAHQEGLQLTVFVCGCKDQIQLFLDTLYKSIAEEQDKSFQAEPFLRDRDFRGVFRFIE